VGIEEGPSRTANERVLDTPMATQLVLTGSAEGTTMDEGRRGGAKVESLTYR